MSRKETYFPAFPGHPRPFISIGLPFAEACRQHVTNTFKSKRVYIIVSKSISQTSTFAVLRDELGDAVVGVRFGIKQHVPWQDVLEVANDLRRLSADLIVTLGAGSLTDGAKVASFAFANSAFTLEDMAKLHIGADPKPDLESLQACRLPIINIPTSLSGGEYTPRGGATDFRTHQKASFQHPSIGASLVILDPAITVSTPERVWLSSGIRAVDHCIEGLCSIFFDGPADEATKETAEDAFTDGLRLILPNLLRAKHKPEDLSARRNCMLGVIGAAKGLKAGVPMGASHGIGHQLGPLGVSHGETSCVLLPSVLRYNHRHGTASARERQAKVLHILQDLGLDLLKRTDETPEASNLGDAMEAIVSGLGLPTTLDEVGVGNEKFKELADNSMKDRYIPTNPVTITHPDQVLEILQMAARP
ncbi:hypothetical protein PFICI_10775 [Pestalotiopsis fici W106-1]|uniref:Uncharacterized protein n=1 Tax=Pestalotiopsis fici (strain W106-1 / CGMCC3.15140) TaxID=1229662 RepID=W3WVM9_PESFW|nr:uncharacterized protein PFICI_10775 [Pestalotiopsis fici W106-1]ETS76901.1 hypothetical protein PFICI_10775 [Pestalotiopsis fici W106-1]